MCLHMCLFRCVFTSVYTCLHLDATGVATCSCGAWLPSPSLVMLSASASLVASLSAPPSPAGASEACMAEGLADGKAAAA